MFLTLDSERGVTVMRHDVTRRVVLLAASEEDIMMTSSSLAASHLRSISS